MILTRMAQTTLFTREQIDRRVAEMAKEISADFAGSELIALCVLKGAVFFCADLVRHMTGVVTILKEPQLDMRGKSVLIVEDIVDSGLSIREVNNYIESRGAARVKTASFLDKPKARKVPFTPDYVGFAIEPQFVIGYGLDFAEKYRNIPEVQVLSD
jgi:hypoxanthine phosphoribosyltransferase